MMQNSSRDCWDIDEIKVLIERLLEDKQKISIRCRPKRVDCTHTSWLVEWQPDKELIGGK